MVKLKKAVPAKQAVKAPKKTGEAADDFASLKIKYLSSAEIKSQKAVAERLEREIKSKRVESTNHLANMLAELVDYPLTQTISDFLCDYLRQDNAAIISSVGYLSSHDHAFMICVHIPAYEEARKKFQRDRTSKASPRERAIEQVFKDVPKLKRLVPSSIIERMRLARRFAEENGVIHFLEEARSLDPFDREDLTIEFLAEL